MVARPLSFGCLNMCWKLKRQHNMQTMIRPDIFSERDGKAGKIDDLCHLDPHTHYHAPAATGYETSGESGCSDWPALFLYVLDHCRGLEHADTVYILVDNRHFTDQTTMKSHWATGLLSPWWKVDARSARPIEHRSVA